MNVAKSIQLNLLKRAFNPSLQTRVVESNPVGITIINRWHTILGVASRPDRSWYQKCLRDEFKERHEARGILEQLSETSDVFYNITRAHHDGHSIGRIPAFNSAHIPVYVYMFGKYTLRWGFYRAVARRCNAPHENIREVINPSKNHKLEKVANRHNIDEARFKKAAHQLRRFWPLLY
ncbi:unnamed protein product [Blumeria hordei]|uniref:Uncharacterized protein n=2 Tax=Blumeria hordei TaxID=2867405 RepID=A0A383UNM4_BLUHO|nr:hypothetical protein BGHDH14_bgh05123 [Blumeria hordei DH14]SZF01389.1 unnamed protein product [Blumeria hordei]